MHLKPFDLDLLLQPVNKAGGAQILVCFRGLARGSMLGRSIAHLGRLGTCTHTLRMCAAKEERRNYPTVIFPAYKAVGDLLPQVEFRALYIRAAFDRTWALNEYTLSGIRIKRNVVSKSFQIFLCCEVSIGTYLDILNNL